jgi:hypothetical protein
MSFDDRIDGISDTRVCPLLCVLFQKAFQVFSSYVNLAPSVSSVCCGVKTFSSFDVHVIWRSCASRHVHEHEK